MANQTQNGSLAMAWLAGALLAVGLLAQVIRQPIAADGLLRVRMLDVGQGDSILIDTPGNQHVLIDGGPADDVVVQLARALVPPQRLRLVVVSHNHQDHIGGLPAVLARYPVEEVWISGAIHTTEGYEQLLHAIQASGSAVQTVQAGYRLTIDQVQLLVLHPIKPMVGERPDNQHDSTVVVKVTYGAVSVLLTGDLDMEHEQALIDHDRAALAASVLKVAHHGSQYGSTARFLQAVHPELAVISVGSDNRYGHPTAAVLERLDAQGIPVYRTDQRGTITITSDGIGITVTTERR